MFYPEISFIECPYCNKVLIDEDDIFKIEQLDEEFDMATVICQECNYFYNIKLEITRNYITEKIEQPIDQEETKDYPDQVHFNFYEKETTD